MAFKFDYKTFGIILILSFVTVTILNVLVHMIAPAIPVIKTGFALVLILAANLIIFLFTVASDGRLDKEEMYLMIAVIVTELLIFWVIKHYIPDLFSLIPQSTKEIFSAVIQ